MKCRLASFLAVLMVLLFFPVATLAQPEWWTLTDMTPKELRAIHEDREQTEKRYRRLVAEGKVEAPEDETEYGQMVMVYLGNDTPELVPLWHAFSSFYGDWAIESRPGLLEAGMSDSGADIVIQYGVYMPQWRQQEGEGVMRRLEPWMEALRKARGELGEVGYREAIQSRRAGSLGSFGGLGAQESEELMALWLGNPVQRVELSRLEDLRLQVTDADWAALKEFLLREVAPHRVWIERRQP